MEIKVKAITFTKPIQIKGMGVYTGITPDRINADVTITCDLTQTVIKLEIGPRTLFIPYAQIQTIEEDDRADSSTKSDRRGSGSADKKKTAGKQKTAGRKSDVEEQPVPGADDIPTVGI